MTIFISYRRSDGDMVGRIHDYLERRLGAGSVFQDVEDIGAGRRFLEQIEGAIEEAEVVVAVVGPDWAQERLHDPSDILRRELELALGGRVPIVPVTLNTTELPAVERIPDSLRPIFEYQSYVVRSGAEFAPSMERLVEGLRALLGLSAAPERAETDDGAGLSRDEWYRKARSQAALGDRRDALRCLAKAIDLDPAFAEAHAYRGVILLLEGRREDAIVALRSALAVNPDDPEAQTLLASSLAASGELHEARWWIEKSLKHERSDGEEGTVRATYADILLQLGQPEAAIEELDRAIRVTEDGAPPYVRAYYLRRMGDALAEVGRLTEALDEYDAAVSCGGPDPEILNAKGLALMRDGRPDEAEEAFLLGLERAADSAGLHFNLACARSLAGEHGPGFTALERALDLDPGLRAAARSDPELASLREADAARFERLVGTGSG